MKLLLPYPEADELLNRYTGREISIAFAATKTVVVEVPVKIGFLKMERRIKVRVTVIRFDGSDLWLYYDAGKVAAVVLPVLISLVKSLNDNPMFDLLPASQMVLHIDKVPAINEALRHVAVSDIYFEPEGAVLEFKVGSKN